MKRLYALVFVVAFLLPFCSSGKQPQEMKLKDFFFYEEKDGKMIKRDSNVYHQGDVVKFYIEIVGFGYRKTDKGYEIRVAEILKVYTSDGDLIHQREVVNTKTTLKELPPYLGFKTKFGLSKGVRIGLYRIEVDIVDGIGKTTLRIEKNIKVKGII